MSASFFIASCAAEYAVPNCMMVSSYFLSAAAFSVAFMPYPRSPARVRRFRSWRRRVQNVLKFSHEWSFCSSHSSWSRCRRPLLVATRIAMSTAAASLMLWSIPHWYANFTPSSICVISFCIPSPGCQSPSILSVLILRSMASTWP